MDSPPNIPPPVVATVPPQVIGQATRIEYPPSPSLRRVRAWTRLLDQSIVLPGGFRIGIDPIIGLIPGIGDVVASLMSMYLVYEGARMGLRKRTLFRMFANVLIEALVGEIPILGDIFDAVWKANVRNLALIEAEYSPALPQRPVGKIWLWMAGFLTIVVGLNVLAIVLFFKLIVVLLESLGWTR